MEKDTSKTSASFAHDTIIQITFISKPWTIKDVVLEEWDLMDLLKYAVVEDNLSLIKTLYCVGENIYVEGTLL